MQSTRATTNWESKFRMCLSVVFYFNFCEFGTAMVNTTCEDAG